MRTPHLALLASILLACAGGGTGSNPPACVAGAACTPAAACSQGEVRCEASGPTCVATAPLPDGTACGQGATCSAGACLRAITVTAADRYHDDAGTVVTVPRASLGDSSFRALVLGADGAYQAFAGSAVAPGVVEIPGVPAGTCLVERRYPGSTVPQLTEVTGNVLDDSWDLAGRADAAYSTLPTRVELLATGLAPWQVGSPDDRLQIVSSNFGLSQDHLAPDLAAGATEATVVPWPGSGPGTPLLDGTAGDRLQVIQLGRVDGPLPYVTPVRSGTLPASFQVVDGIAQLVPVPLAPIARTGTLSADWAIGEMEALLGEMGPSAGPYPLHLLTLTAWPHGLAPGGGALLELAAGSSGGTLSVGPLEYGRPYPDFFVEGGEARMTADVQVPLPDPARPTFSESATTLTWLGSPAAGRLSVRPELSPPRSVRVAGLDVGRRPQAGVGLAPTITWSPPSAGRADQYRVTLRRVVTDTYARTVARFTVTATELRVPPGLLQAGASHYVRIAASGANGYAETVTAGFAP